MGLQNLFGRTAILIAATAALSACTSSPPAETIAADDEMLCRYSAGAAASQSYDQCRSRLTRQRTHVLAANATQIDATQPNAVALIGTPTEVAACKEADPKNCPPASEVTGTIPAQPKTAPKP